MDSHRPVATAIREFASIVNMTSTDDASALPLTDAGLPRVGTIWLLTTTGRDGTLRSRPVTIAHSVPPNEIVFLTGPEAKKVSEVEHQAEISLAGHTSDSWWAAEAHATVSRDPDRIARYLTAVGMPPTRPAVAIRLMCTRIRTWHRGPEGDTRTDRPF